MVTGTEVCGGDVASVEDKIARRAATFDYRLSIRS